MINSDDLKSIMPTCSQSTIDIFIPFIDASFEEFDISTPLTQSAFLAQAAFESVELSHLAENLNYSAERLLAVFYTHFEQGEALGFAHNPEKIANRVYANRMGNGDESTGDGWKYKGRGIFQMTGKFMYEQCGLGLGIDLLNNPELLEEPENATRSAAWFWDTHSCNSLAEQGLFRTITQKINGGMNGYNERVAYFEKAKSVLGVDA